MMSVQRHSAHVRKGVCAARQLGLCAGGRETKGCRPEKCREGRELGIHPEAHTPAAASQWSCYMLTSCIHFSSSPLGILYYCTFSVV